MYMQYIFLMLSIQIYIVSRRALRGAQAEQREGRYSFVAKCTVVPSGKQ